METDKINKKNAGGALRQALERRQTEPLQSNFSFIMMEQIRLHVNKQSRKSLVLGWLSVILAAFLLIGMGIYFLFFYMNVNIFLQMQQINMQEDVSLMNFYIYIATIVLVLLCIDRWLRKKFFKIK